MLTVIKKDNTTEEFIDEKIVDAVKKAAFRCDTLIGRRGPCPHRQRSPVRALRGATR